LSRPDSLQAGKHNWFYYTSTKCSISDDNAGQQLFWEALVTSAQHKRAKARWFCKQAERVVAPASVERSLGCIECTHHWKPILAYSNNTQVGLEMLDEAKSAACCHCQYAMD
jgi:hypothetical protein